MEKKIFQFCFALYTPPANNSLATNYNSADQNALASQYADDYSHGTTETIDRIVRNLIFDTAPKQYNDLAILNLARTEPVNSDEFHYAEMGLSRKAILNGTIAVQINSGATQVVPITNPQDITVDTIVAYGSANNKAIVRSIDVGNGTMTIASINGQVLPAIPATAEGALPFSNLSSIEADGQNYISQYFRDDPITSYNYVQMFVKAMRFGKMELFKYQRAGKFSNYLSMNKERLINEFRTDLSNAFWNGQRGEYTLGTGAKAKSMGGVIETMAQAGAPHVPVNIVNVGEAIEELAFATDYKSAGSTRFLYAEPRLLRTISLQLKEEKTRYSPGDRNPLLNLTMIDLESTKIVFVPMPRFKERAYFPEVFSRRIVVLDQESITPMECWGMQMDETLDRESGTLNNYKDFIISGTFSQRYVNPLGGFIIDVNGI